MALAKLWHSKFIVVELIFGPIQDAPALPVDGSILRDLLQLPRNHADLNFLQELTRALGFPHDLKPIRQVELSVARPPSN